MPPLSTFKRLASETALYGLPSIIGRFLNWLLVPLYVRVLPSTADFGAYTNIYGWTAILLILLTCGMETAFFRFINKPQEQHPMRVYSSAFTFVALLSILFATIALFFAHDISAFLGFPSASLYIRLMILVVSFDAIAALPFAFLRYQRNALRFALLRLFSIVLNIALNLFFFLLCPILHFSFSISSVGFIFLANFITSALTLLLLFPQILPVFRVKPDFFRLSQMFRYAFPILLLGIAGIFNQTADKILFPLLFTDKTFANQQLGIYSACFKIAAVMVMFIQAFRYAYEPFIFAQHKQSSSFSAYVITMRYFILAALFLFLVVTLYIDFWKLFITPAYYSGLPVIPVILAAEIFFGIYFNLSLWYKLTDQTYWGAIFSIGGCVITVSIIFFFAPVYGFMACAWASFVCNLVMMITSYVMGKRRLAVPYDIGSALRAVVITFFIYGISIVIRDFFPDLTFTVTMVYRTVLLLLFVLFIYRYER